jgi:hypothetical protein
MRNSDRATKGRFRWHWDRRRRKSEFLGRPRRQADHGARPANVEPITGLLTSALGTASVTVRMNGKVSSYSTTREQNTLTHLLLSFATQGCTGTRPGTLADNRKASSPLTSRPSRVDRKADAEQVFLIIVQSASPPRHAAAPDKFTSKPLASFHGVTLPSEGEHQKGGRRRGDCDKPRKGQLSGKAYATLHADRCRAALRSPPLRWAP